MLKRRQQGDIPYPISTNQQPEIYEDADKNRPEKHNYSSKEQ